MVDLAERSRCVTCGRWIGEKNYLCDRFSWADRYASPVATFECSLGHETVLYLPVIWAKDFLVHLDRVHMDSRDYEAEIRGK